MKLFIAKAFRARFTKRKATSTSSSSQQLSRRVYWDQRSCFNKLGRIYYKICRAYYVSVFYYFPPLIMLINSSLLGVLKQTYQQEYNTWVANNCSAH